MTVAAFWERWASLNLRPRQPDTITHTLQMTRSFRRQFKQRTLESLTEDDIRAYAAEHPASVKYLKAILSDAVLAGLIDVSPAAGVPIPRSQPRTFVPSMDEVMALADAAPEHFRPLVIVAACSGGRLSALANLQASDVEHGPEPGTMTLHLKRKRHEDTYPAVLIAPGVAWMEGLWSLQRGGVVFDRRPPTLTRWDRSTVAREMTRARRHAGLPEEFTFHALRKRYASTLLDMGVSDMDVAIGLDHVDMLGRPNPELVRRIYGRPQRGPALERIAATAIAQAAAA